MANELTTMTVATTTTDLAHANLARYAKDAQGAFAPNTAWFKTGGLWVTPKVTGAAPTKGFHVSRVTRI